MASVLWLMPILKVLGFDLHNPTTQVVELTLGLAAGAEVLDLPGRVAHQRRSDHTPNRCEEAHFRRLSASCTAWFVSSCNAVA